MNAAIVVMCGVFAGLGAREGNLPVLGIFVALALFKAEATVHALLWEPFASS
jgi:hypothetical protein